MPSARSQAMLLADTAQTGDPVELQVLFAPPGKLLKLVNV